jgi:hypothetical protein
MCPFVRAPSPSPATPSPSRRSRRRLVAVLLLCLLPFSLAACSLIGGSRPGGAATSYPTGYSSLVYIKGSTTASPVPAGGTYPGARLLVPSLPYVSPASMSPWPGLGYCPGQLYQGKLDGLSVAAGYGSATITWYGANNVQVLSYRVSSVSQHLVAGPQPAPPTVLVAPGKACQQLSVTVTGLAHQTYYVFWLDVTFYLNMVGETKNYEIGRSHGIYIP